MKDFEKIVDEIAQKKASAIDAHLSRFLAEQGIMTKEWNAIAMKKELKNKSFEIIHEVTRTSESEIHTFKLCKVYGQTSLEIQNPVIAPLCQI